MAGFLSLSWNNHSLAFLNLLNSLHSKDLYCDVTIACHGKFYPVHRMVLSTCSEYFQEIFALTQCKHPFIIVNDAQPPELEALLEYMYKGNINVPQSNLPTLLKAAEALRIKGLAVPDNITSDKEVSKKRSSSQNPSSKKLKLATKEKSSDPMRSSPEDRGREAPAIIFEEDKEEPSFKEESIPSNEIIDESVKRLGQEDPSNSINEPLVKSEPYDSSYPEDQVVNQDGLLYSNNTEWPAAIGENHEDNQQSHSLIEGEEFLSILERKINDRRLLKRKDSKARTKLVGTCMKDQSTSTSTCGEDKNPFIFRQKESLTYSESLSQANALSPLVGTNQRIQARSTRFKIRVISNPWVKRYCKSMFETHTEEKDPLYSQLNLGYLGYFD